MKFVCVDDYEAEAARRLPKQAYDYYRSGADDERTLADNRQCFSKWSLLEKRKNALRQILDPSAHAARRVPPQSVRVDTGQFTPHPLPDHDRVDRFAAHGRRSGRGGHGRRYDFIRLFAQNSSAAARLRTIMMCSTISTTSLEAIAAASPGSPKFFQLYIYKVRAETEKLLRRVEAYADYKALVLTVDTPFAGKRRADERNAFALPKHLKWVELASDE